MRFFKYLIFTFISLFSINSYSALQWIATDAKDNIWSSSADSACRRYALVRFPGSTVSGDLTINIGSPLSTCRIPIKTSAGTLINDLIYLKNQTVPDPECWHPDYKIVSQDVNNSQIKKSICVLNNGVMCKYTTNTTALKNASVINGYITTTFDSVSKTPDPNCQEELVNPPCDPKDPYGGCYTPPNQECTRQSDGSIMCPSDSPEPDISKGCANGATYCERPPTGCGDKYVPGTFNGKQICVKKSEPNTDPEPPVDPENPDPPDPENPDPPQDVDLSAVIAAINAVTAAVNKVTAAVQKMSQEVVYAINIVASKIDVTNTKLDEVKTKIDKTNTELSQANDNLTDLNDKAQTSNDLLTQIKDAVNSIKNNQGTGGGTGDGGSDSELPDPESGDLLVNQIDTPKISDSTFSFGAVCPAPIQENISIIGYSWDFYFSFESYCTVLSRLSNWFVFSSFLAAAFIVAGVRDA